MCGGSAPFAPKVSTRVWIWSCARAWSSTPQLDSTIIIIIPAVENCSGNPRNGGVEIHKKWNSTYVRRTQWSFTYSILQGEFSWRKFLWRMFVDLHCKKWFQISVHSHCCISFFVYRMYGVHRPTRHLIYV